MIALLAACGVLLFLALTLVRLFVGPTLYDRALAANSVVLKAVVICAALAVALDNAAGAEVAFALLLGAFVLNIAVLKFFRARTFQAPLARAEDGR